ncbi:MAG: hypothetical protein ACRYGO_19025 [Janthinobacterium lividum]
MSIHQAIGWRDHAMIDKIVLAGTHPLSVIEHCIEVRGDAIEVLMAHVPMDCESNQAIVRRVVAHLKVIGRYHHALVVLEAWLSKSMQKRAG